MKLPSHVRRRFGLAMIGALLLAPTASADRLAAGGGGDADASASPQVRTHGGEGGALEPPLPDPADFPVQLVLDDDSAENDFGFNGAESAPFLWLNRFSMTPPFAVEEMWVLFPQDSTLDGADVQLAVYQDADGDPTDGATLLATFDVVVQETDGQTFSVYTLDPPVEITDGDAYLGVVSRYAESPTPPTFPAVLDTTASAGRSWVAVWTGGPPAIPELPGDDENFLIDDFLPGNWLIRAFGRSTLDVLEIPTLGTVGLAAMALLLLIFGAVTMRRRSVAEPAAAAQRPVDKCPAEVK
ncbi:MAG: IPTL-CTERM sorting domain-containing protein [Acidobacteriota bacterium]